MDDHYCVVDEGARTVSSNDTTTTPDNTPGKPPPDAPGDSSAALSALLRVLGAVERAGNKLPHPFWLFAVLSAVLALISWGLATADVSAVDPAGEKTVAVRSLISVDGVRSMINDAITNYATFPRWAPSWSSCSVSPSPTGRGCSRRCCGPVSPRSRRAG
ncbi:hypothetical protein SVIO_098510 [Streptomyces violaceusniger]|uniref:Uncharacterized protein n=1 Tax=Streptomyces violaceusniger TaxID=68280 RepID=A0A4D4LLA9_STRVO|nr:hypothetical protein SVIO_098510 [Streptomyces violaceusniger]